MYSVKPKNANRFRHDYARLTPAEREKVRRALEGLAEDPRPPGCICLEKNYYRLRVGNIRILYQILDAERTVLIGAISRRDERTYKDWKKCFK
ncbi:mRNA interferase RelE/StbE [Desulfofundulus australicus DSM 11792]|uniref:mRNA interferase RelE/StbE n=2 Tax=Desulfofundulus TaxID=2282741 RepID=A0A1M5CQY1_9FIRM|nr:type II toxin-antitoxin system RelE/ParE family toxin [Desulfofundulus sp. TPOSR]AEG15633.1 plasmid stabilization system [Desulfofundulus kuznetsovii DSM 6115]NHM27699.1 type II toxin-antitoxin system RelE/ParE family toxin [Desulfofundulus sp. TPOSR]SHF57151.1 mRNA interferase RelE/StbE [Desulfofundulus australicus DSM 11792]